MRAHNLPLKQLKNLITSFGKILRLVIIALVFATPVNSYAQAQEEVQARLAESLEWEDWESRAYDLIDAMDEHEDITPTGPTQATAFQTLQTIYNQRIDYFQQTMGEETDIEALQLLLSSAEDSNFFSEQDQQKISKFQRVANVEQALFDSQDSSSYRNRLTKLSAIQNTAEDEEFSTSTHLIFFNQITQVFNDRNQRTDRDVSKLRQVLVKGTKTPLLDGQQHDIVKGYLALLDLENSIRAATANEDYPAKVGSFQNIQDENQSKEFNEITQNLYFAGLEGAHNDRSGQGMDETAALINLLDGAQTTPLLTEEQQGKIKEFLDQLGPERALLALRDITDFDQLQQALQALLDKYGTADLSDLAKQLFADATNKLFENRPNDDAEKLKALHALLTQAGNGNFGNDSLEGILPTLLAEAEGLEVKDKINQAMTQPDFNSKNTSLAQILDDMSNGQQLPENIQGAVQDSLSQALANLFENRPTDNAQELENLNNLLSKAGENPLVNDELKNSLENNMMPGLLGELALHNAMNSDSFDGKLQAMGKALQDLQDKDVDPKTQSLANNALQNIFNNRPQDNLDHLNQLTSMLGDLQDNPALSAQAQNQLQNSMLPSLGKDTTRLSTQQDLADLMSNTDFDSRLGGMDELMQKLAGKDLDDQTKNMLSNSMNGLFNARPQEDAQALEKLKGLMENAQKSPLLNPQAQSNIANNMLAQLATDANSANANQALNDVLNSGDYDERLGGMDKLMQDLAGKQLNPAAQQRLDNAVKQLFAQRPKQDPESLSNLADLMNTAQNTSLLNADSKNAIASSMLPQLATDKNSAQAQQDINAIMSQDDFDDRLGGMDELMQKLAAQKLNPETQQLVGQKMKELFAQRPKQDEDALNNLTSLINNAKSNPAVPLDVKNSIDTNMLPQLNNEQANAQTGAQLAEVSQAGDFDDQVQAMKDMMQQLGGKALNPQAQQQVAGKLQDLFNSRPQDDAESLNHLQQLLGQGAQQGLLDPTTQQRVQAQLLPTLVKDQSNATAREELANAISSGDYQDKLDAVNEALTRAAAQGLDPRTNTTLAQALKDLIDTKPLDPEILASLSDVLQKAQTISSVNPTLKQLISSNYLPQVAQSTQLALAEQAAPAATTNQAGATTPQANALAQLGQQPATQTGMPATQGQQAAAPAGMPGTQAQTTPATGMPGMQQQQTAQASGMPGTQGQAAAQAQQLAQLGQQQATTPAGMPGTQAQTTQAGGMPGTQGQLPVASQQQAQPVTAQTVTAQTMGGQLNLAFEQELEQAMQEDSTLAKVDAVTLVVNRHANSNVPIQSKNAFAQAIQELFTQRYAPMPTQTVKTVKVARKAKKKKKKRKKKKKKKKKKRKKKKKKKKRKKKKKKRKKKKRKK